MSEWQSIRIGQHVTIIPGFPFDSNRFDDEDGVPLVRIRDLRAGTTETKFNGHYDPLYLISPGDIVVGMDGDFNVARWKGGAALLNQRMLKIADKKSGEIDCSFLFYVLDPLLKDINNKTSATTVKHLSTYDISEAFIPAPPLPQQRKIARILTTVDNLIEKTEALIAKYQAIKQGMMHDLFTRGVDEHGHLRPPYEEAPELYKQSELGWIPKEWEVCRVGDCLEQIEQGWSPDCESVPASAGEWGVLKTTAVVWEGFASSENKRLPRHLTPLPQYEVRGDDVLMTRGGPNSRVGVVAHVRDTPEKLMLSDKIYRLIPKRNLLPSYFALALSSERTQTHLSMLKTGLAESQTNISQEIVKRLWIGLPSPEEQRKSSERIDTVHQVMKAELNVLAKLRLQKSGLMHDLLTGKVRVKVDEDKEKITDHA